MLQQYIMSRIRYHISHNPRELADRYIAIQSDTSQNPLKPDILLTQSLAIKQWLSLYVSSHTGIWANIMVMFPERFMEWLIRQCGIMPEVTYDPWHRDSLTWRIMQSMDALDENSLVHKYSATSSLHRYQLSQQLAMRFDDYQIFRPQWISEWKPDDTWQAKLWHTLVNEITQSHPGIPHRTERFRQLIDRITKDTPDILPSRITLFGITSLIPLHQEIFTALSHTREVHYFMFNPSPRHYWFDTQPAESGIERARKQNLSYDDAHYDQGHRLLSLWGKATAEVAVISGYLDTSEAGADESLLFDQPDDGTTLGLLQRGIINGEDISRIPRATGDGSITIHSCHNQLREMQVVRDYLYQQFSAMPDLAPHEVAVALPNLNDYGDAIEAVFGGEKIPYHVADTQQDAPLLHYFQRLLQIITSRCTAEDFLELLESEPVLRRFSLTIEDTTMVRSWLAQNRTSWGISAEHRMRASGASIDDDDAARNAGTLSGLRYSLLMQYCMDGAGRNEWLYGTLHGFERDTAGAMFTLLRELEELESYTEEPRTADQWRVLLLPYVTVWNNSDYDQELLHIMQSLARIAGEVSIAGFEDRLPFETFRGALSIALDRYSARPLYRRGGVIFTEPLHLQMVPYRVICFAGMDEKSFAFADRKQSFDLMASQRKRGDRSGELEDREIFLQAVMTASDKFCITYSGLNETDGSDIPPSSVVRELMDFLHVAPGESFTEDGIFFRHSLYPHRNVYITSDSLFPSYDSQQYSIALALREKKQHTPFLDFNGDETEEHTLVLSPDEFIGFFRKPMERYCGKFLQIRFRDDTEEIHTEELVELSGLSRYYLKKKLIDHQLTHVDAEIPHRQFRMEGLTPAGNWGYTLLQAQEREVMIFTERLKTHGIPFEPLSRYMDISMGMVTIRGSLNVSPEGKALRWHSGTLKASHLLSSWIEAILLTHSSGEASESLCLGFNSATKTKPAEIEEYRFTMSPEEASHSLTLLCDIYYTMMDKGEWMPLFIDSGYAYSKEYHASRNEFKAEKAAKDRYTGSGWNSGPGEGDTPCPQLLTDGAGNPLQPGFTELAWRVFSPMLMAMEKKEESKG